MRKAVNFVFGAVFGGFIGGAAILLMAPGSGQETRAAIKERFLSLRAEVRTAIAEKRAELESELQTYKTGE